MLHVTSAIKQTPSLSPPLPLLIFYFFANILLTRLHFSDSPLRPPDQYWVSRPVPPGGLADVRVRPPGDSRRPVRLLEPVGQDLRPRLPQGHRLHRSLHLSSLLQRRQHRILGLPSRLFIHQAAEYVSPFRTFVTGKWFQCVLQSASLKKERNKKKEEI